MKITRKLRVERLDTADQHTFDGISVRATDDYQTHLDFRVSGGNPDIGQTVTVTIEWERTA